MTLKQELPNILLDETIDFQKMNTMALIEVLSNVHHVYLIEQMSIIDGIMSDIRINHAKHYMELIPVIELTDSIFSELKSHIDAEETTLFPSILGSIEMETGQFEFEHEESLGAIKQLNRITDAFNCPIKESVIMRFYDALHDLCNVLYNHIYVENRYLISRITK